MPTDARSPEPGGGAGPEKGAASAGDDAASSAWGGSEECAPAAKGGASESTRANDHAISSGRSARLAIETIETVLTALVLAFIFRAFFIEAFIIPTGSMAESLRGEHRTLVCRDCGCEFAVGALTPDERGGGSMLAADGPPTCPGCHRVYEGTLPPTKPGDRILVHKWPFELGGFFGPRPWDVIVFRDPADARQNYIKRLIALPGEDVEIVDGDVFVNGRIRRKTPAAQRVLWFPVHDQRFVPSLPREGEPPSAWEPAAYADDPGGGWSGLDSRVVRYDSSDARPRALDFAPGGVGPYHQDFYAYNGGSAGTHVGDLAVSALLRFSGERGELRVQIERRRMRFSAVLRADGSTELRAAGSDGENERTVAQGASSALRSGGSAEFRLEHVDWRVRLMVNGSALLEVPEPDYAVSLDTARECAGWGARLRLEGADARLELRELRVERDVHYTTHASRTRRAMPGQAFELMAGEYFVMGDNTPHSHDSREWSMVGPHLRHDYYEDRYRLGTVREDQIVGRAFFVYLPGVVPMDSSGRWRMLDVGRVRMIQ
ncbi:MAG: signal peptidase I [Phycisphaerales bacterium]|nr:signal peptidase I [Phycisphaerales bacterium]